MNMNLCFLGEDDYIDVMSTENEIFVREHVKRDSFRTPDGTSLCYYHACPDDPKAAVVMVHGMAEFFGKYREYIWYLYREGFEVFFMEQRGHGHSGGKAPEIDVIYIDSYNTYVEDLHAFVSGHVLPHTGDLPLFMIAHSMGGCVGALFLEKYPGIFKAAILSSPMFKLKGAKYPAPARALIRLYALLTGRLKKLAPNQKHFDPDARVEDSSSVSPARFHFLMEQRKNDTYNQMTGASFGWALASMSATVAVIRHADRIKIPVTVMTAGHDHLIDPSGYEAFKKKVPQARFHAYADSRHEIFNSGDVSRKKYFSDVISTLFNHIGK